MKLEIELTEEAVKDLMSEVGTRHFLGDLVPDLCMADRLLLCIAYALRKEKESIRILGIRELREKEKNNA